MLHFLGDSLRRGESHATGPCGPNRLGWSTPLTISGWMRLYFAPVRVGTERVAIFDLALTLVELSVSLETQNIGNDIGLLVGFEHDIWHALMGSVECC